MAQLWEHLQMSYIARLLEIDAFAEFSKSWLNNMSITWKDANVPLLLHRYLRFWAHQVKSINTVHPSIWRWWNSIHITHSESLRPGYHRITWQHLTLTFPPALTVSPIPCVCQEIRLQEKKSRSFPSLVVPVANHSTVINGLLNFGLCLSAVSHRSLLYPSCKVPRDFSPGRCSRNNKVTSPRPFCEENRAL